MMNILHHKSWHVRTKSNMERVRRDERKAAEEEQRVLDRQIQAENERRINTLRARADDRMSTMFGSSSTSTTKDVSISDETGHVNLFQDLEREERKNLGSGNKEYAEEKAQEKKEWESKMGIQVYFADNTNDLNKKKEWWEEERPARKGPEKAKLKDALPCLREEERKRKRDRSESEERSKKRKKERKDKKKKKKKKHRRSESEERHLEEEYDRERKRKLAAMRDERLKRERAEKARTHALLHPEEEKKRQVEEAKGRPKYNSQFNPEFSRR